MSSEIMLLDFGEIGVIIPFLPIHNLISPRMRRINGKSTSGVEFVEVYLPITHSTSKGVKFSKGLMKHSMLRPFELISQKISVFQENGAKSKLSFWDSKQRLFTYLA